ncbi:MAG: hypothetical protein ACT4PV_08885 [Planctomycetaceae bacterium]
MRLVPAALVALALAAHLPATAEEGLGSLPLYNARITDSKGVELDLAGVHLLSGRDRFEGTLGASSIEVPFDRLRRIDVREPAAPGRKMRAALTLRSGAVVDALFDERQAEEVVAGFGAFGRAMLPFRSVRALLIEGRTARQDLPDFGPASAGVDARLRDSDGTVLEVAGFRRAGGTNVLRGMRGDFVVEVPLRNVRRLELMPRRADGPARLGGTVTLAGGQAIPFDLPAYEERSVYRGEAEFGSMRIALADVRLLEVHRPTPPVRDLDPVESARGGDDAEDGLAR